MVCACSRRWEAIDSARRHSRRQSQSTNFSPIKIPTPQNIILPQLSTSSCKFSHLFALKCEFCFLTAVSRNRRLLLLMCQYGVQHCDILLCARMLCEFVVWIQKLDFCVDCCFSKVAAVSLRMTTTVALLLRRWYGLSYTCASTVRLNQIVSSCSIWITSNSVLFCCRKTHNHAIAAQGINCHWTLTVIDVGYGGKLSFGAHEWSLADFTLF
jgi:hypothetical protein